MSNNKQPLAGLITAKLTPVFLSVGETPLLCRGMPPARSPTLTRAGILLSKKGVIMSGKVYLCFDGSGLWKIGITKDEKKRLSQMRTGNPTIRMLFALTIDNPAVTELELHTKFENKRVAGEWFDLSPEDLFYLFKKFLGEQNTHTLNDFETMHRVISKEKRAADYEWLAELDKRFEEVK